MQHGNSETHVLVPFTAHRLGDSDVDLAQRTFTLMAEVFDETKEQLSDNYVKRLLGGEGFWGFTATRDDQVVGGLTAHVLPMTNSERFEVFIFDLAVDERFQRKGVGRLLVDTLRHSAAAVGASSVFVPADNDDLHALDFYRSLGATGAAVTMFDFN